MPRFLVTGATGFVGRRLCRTLLAQGNSVVAAVRKTSATDTLPHNVERTVIDGLGPETKWDRPLLQSVDIVVHLAARVHVMNDSANDPTAEFQRVNVAGTEQLFRSAAGSIKRFVFVSSLHAMHSLTDELLNEQSPCSPDTPYGQSKLDAEKIVRTIGKETNTETVIVRPPPVYGPGNLGNLQKLFRTVRAGWPLPLGSINNRRSLVYVENLVDALAICTQHPQAAGETFLISDGDPISIAELIRETATAFNRPARLWPFPPRFMKIAGKLTGKTGTVNRLLGSLAVDDQRIRRTIGWNPPFTLQDGLRTTAKWVTGTAENGHAENNAEPRAQNSRRAA